MTVAEVVPEYEHKSRRRSSAPDAAPQRGSRQAGVAVLSALAALAALQIGTAVVLNVWFPGIIDPKYGNRLPRVREGRAADPAHTHTVVMVGSSRTYYGLHSDSLSNVLTATLGRPVSVVNAAYFGAGPLTELLFWQRLRRQGYRPDLLLIEVMPAYLNDAWPAAEMREEQMPTSRIGWFDLPLLERYLAGTRPNLRRDVVLADANPFYSRRANIIRALAPCLLLTKTAILDEAAGPGFLPADPTPGLRQKALDWAHAEYRSLAHLSFAGRDRSTGALRELLASCHQAAVPTRLVLMPEGPVFRSWYGQGAWPKFRESMEQFCREEGTELVFAHEWIDEDDFMDSHHLLPRGADKFTERLGREVILPLLRQQEQSRPRQSVLTRVAAP